MPTQLTTRQRALPQAVWTKPGGTHTREYSLTTGALLAENQTSVSYLNRAQSWAGTQVTASEGHPVSQLSKPGLRDIGGPFSTTRRYVSKGIIRDTHTTTKNLTGRKIIKDWNGVLIPWEPLSGGKLAFPPDPASSDSALDTAGATAIALCKPTNSPVDAAVAIGELFKEGLPSLVGSKSWQTRAATAKNAGSEYLNVQFGWMPLISEISDFAKTVSKFDTVLAQYERDAGRVVRRRYEFPEQRTVTETRVSSENAARVLCIPADTDLLNGSKAGTVFRTRETVRRQWFSGAFTYYLPTGYDSRDKLSKLRLIADRFGVSLSPDTVWELAPWSWAADWFSNAGDVISNVSDFASGGLVMRYGYVMEHSITTDTYSLVGFVPGQLAPTVRADDLVLVTETKKRRQANPFGFGVTWEGLSAFQASILAALGISRR